MSAHDDEPVLDTHAQSLLAAFREEEQLPAEVRERVWSRLDEGAQPIAPAPASNNLPWILGGVAAAAAAVLAIVALSGETTTQHEGDRGQQAPNVVEQPQPQPSAVPALEAPREPVLERASPPREAVEPTPSPPRPRARPNPTPAPEQPTTTSSLAEETRLLEQARRAVVQDDPARALAILKRSATRFPNGVLLEERAALRVVALCADGQDNAGHKAAATFLRNFPSSALRTRVADACTSD